MKINIYSRRLKKEKYTLRNLINKMKNNQLIVYTALFGNYDELIEPTELYNNCKFVCFTDQKNLKSKYWEVVYVQGKYENNTLNNRFYKINPHKYFQSYSYSLYVDSNIKIFKSPYDLLNKYLKGYDIAAPVHERKNCIYAEAIDCIKKGKVSKEDLSEQIKNYKNEGYPYNNGLYEMNIIFRKHNNRGVINLMNMWWDHFTKYSKRDQISFPYCLWKTNTQIGAMYENSHFNNSYFMSRPHTNEKKVIKIKSYIKRLLLTTFFKNG